LHGFDRQLTGYRHHFTAAGEPGWLKILHAVERNDGRWVNLEPRQLFRKHAPGTTL
jgi:hypothetical protein